MSAEWKYRVVKADTKQGPVYRVFGVKYAPDDSPLGHTTEPISPYGASLDELSLDIAEVRAALQQPVLGHDLKDVEAPYVMSSDYRHKETHLGGLNLPPMMMVVAGMKKREERLWATVCVLITVVVMMGLYIFLGQAA